MVNHPSSEFAIVSALLSSACFDSNDDMSIVLRLRPVIACLAYRPLSRVPVEALGYVPRRSFIIKSHITNQQRVARMAVRTVCRWCVFELNSTSSPMNNELPFFSLQIFLLFSYYLLGFSRFLKFILFYNRAMSKPSDQQSKRSHHIVDSTSRFRTFPWKSSC